MAATHLLGGHFDHFLPAADIVVGDQENSLSFCAPTTTLSDPGVMWRGRVAVFERDKARKQN